MQVSTEVKILCSRKNPTLLRKTSKEDLMKFEFKSLCDEWQQKAPIFYSFLLMASTTSKSSVQTWSPSMALAGSILLKQRNCEMNAAATVLGILSKTGSIETTLKRLSKLKLTASNSCILSKLDQMGEDHDIQLQNAKKEITKANVHLELLLDKKSASTSFLDRANIAKENEKHQESSPPGFVVSFDNIDLNLHRRNMTATKQNRDYHWVNHKMIENRVSGNHLDSKKAKSDILVVQNLKFLPTIADNEKQRMDYIVLTSRILTDYFEQLAPLKDVCINHIPHRYSKEMSSKSSKVPLGVIFKNENINEEMLAVLQKFHTYLPQNGKGEVDTQLFAGDQLSVERAVNTIASVANGYTQEERLDGINLQLGDWHAGVKLLTLNYNRFYSGKSDDDHCTLFSDRSLINRRNVNGEPKLAYRADRDFLEVEVKTRVIAAAMSTLDFKDKTDTAKSSLPSNLQLMMKSERHKALVDISAKVVDEFIFDQGKASVMVDAVLLEQEKENLLQQGLNEDGRFPCRFEGCSKSFAFNGKSRRNHELSHNPPVVIEEQNTFSPSKPKPEDPSLPNLDDIFNYNCALLADGYLFLIFSMQ
ncbi:uncharacterized protein LOC111330730 [Stylophora pistillata]|nr:uncharacterized protein LOC111330730 [Stylophora pistillata]